MPLREPDEPRMVFVGNLPWSLKWQELKDHMKAAGKVEFSKIFTHDGRSRGIGYVRYATEPEARNAITTLNQSNIRGRQIILDEWKPAGGTGGKRLSVNTGFGATAPTSAVEPAPCRVHAEESWANWAFSAAVARWYRERAVKPASRQVPAQEQRLPVGLVVAQATLTSLAPTTLQEPPPSAPQQELLKVGEATRLEIFWRGISSPEKFHRHAQAVLSRLARKRAGRPAMAMAHQEPAIVAEASADNLSFEAEVLASWESPIVHQKSASVSRRLSLASTCTDVTISTEVDGPDWRQAELVTPSASPRETSPESSPRSTDAHFLERETPSSLQKVMQSFASFSSRAESSGTRLQFPRHQFAPRRESCWPEEIMDLLCPEESSSGSGMCSQMESCKVPSSSSAGRLQLKAGSAQVPDPRKKHDGEDSLFICPEGTAFGVADGVGSYGANFGLNPRAFADELMMGARAAGELLRADHSMTASERAGKMLLEGYNATRSFGASTAIVAALDPSGRRELGVANLGDSGLRLIRWKDEGGPFSKSLGPEIVLRTQEQQHGFNWPFQLQRLPKEADFPQLLAEGKRAFVRAVMRLQEVQSSKEDLPSDAEQYVVPIQAGDLVLLGTDGVFDNLYDHELRELVSFAVWPTEVAISEGTLVRGPPPTDPTRLAQAIAKAASLRSQDVSAATPFSDGARAAGKCHRGGKQDDISVVAAWVVSKV